MSEFFSQFPAADPAQQSLTAPPGAMYAQLRRQASSMRVALVHDWLLGMRGGERVLESLLRLFPTADLYTLFYDPRGVSETINRRAVFASPLSSLPRVGRYYRHLLPFLPHTMNRLRLGRRYDLVISVSHCVAHGARPAAGVPHVTYCNSPMRYLYDQGEAYAEGGADGWSMKALNLIAPLMRRWDAAAAGRNDAYFGNSRFISERIHKAYGIEAKVIYPPVRTDFFRLPERGEAARKPDAPYLVVSALAPYKRVDLAIKAAHRLGRELLIAGTGQAEESLRRLVADQPESRVKFLGWVSDEKLRELYQTTIALIFPGTEDFGIVPLEAMACGLPVLALRAGGLLETHMEGITGEFFDAPTEVSLTEAWEKFRPEIYDPNRIRYHAEQFGESRFLDQFAQAISRWSGAPLEAGEMGYT